MVREACQEEELLGVLSAAEHREVGRRSLRLSLQSPLEGPRLVAYPVGQVEPAVVESLEEVPAVAHPAFLAALLVGLLEAFLAVHRVDRGVASQEEPLEDHAEAFLVVRRGVHEVAFQTALHLEAPSRQAPCPEAPCPAVPFQEEDLVVAFLVGDPEPLEVGPVELLVVRLGSLVGVHLVEDLLGVHLVVLLVAFREELLVVVRDSVEEELQVVGL